MQATWESLHACICAHYTIVVPMCLHDVLVALMVIQARERHVLDWLATVILSLRATLSICGYATRFAIQNLARVFNRVYARVRPGAAPGTACKPIRKAYPIK